MSRSAWCLSLLAMAMVGCGERSVFGPAEDAGFDGALPDSGIDGGLRDGGRDAPVTDTGGLTPDVPMDTGIDARDGGALDGDVPVDAALDVAIDVAADASTDAPSDTPLDAPRLGPAPVVLGPSTDVTRAGAYVLIGKTGITNVSGSSIRGGHVGVSPEASTAITGFSLVLDASGQFSTSIAVVAPGRVYAADYAAPTPANLTAAILDMEGAYADAASRVSPDFTNLASGHLGGRTLAPGLYTWMSSVDVTSELTFDGGTNDVWILQIANDVDLSAATSMLLAGGAQASNIFWQVAGSVTVHTDAHFEGILLCSTGITFQNGASLHGRALAQTLAALDDDVITAP